MVSGQRIGVMTCSCLLYLHSLRTVFGWLQSDMNCKRIRVRPVTAAVSFTEISPSKRPRRRKCTQQRHSPRGVALLSNSISVNSVVHKQFTVRSVPNHFIWHATYSTIHSSCRYYTVVCLIFEARQLSLLVHMFLTLHSLGWHANSL